MLDRERIRLLVITMLYEPDCVGIAAIASDMCAGLAERGHDVTVYTTYPFYPEWKLKSNVNPWRIQQESIGRVNVRRHGLFIPSKPSRLLPRLMHEASFPISLMRSLFDRRRYDAVMAYCPLLGSVAFAAFRKLFRGEPLWVNIQDIPADFAAASGIYRSRLLRHGGALIQKYLFQRGEIWSSISPHMIKRLETMKATETAIHLCPNWLTGSLRERVQQLPSKVGRLPHDPLKLLYCGTIGKKQGLLEFCQKIKTYDINFRFQIQGSGGEASAVSQWLKANEDQRFYFSGLLPEADFVQALHAADWFVVPEKSGAGFSFLPSKLIPSVSVGTPVLAISDRTGPLGQEVAEHKVGVVMEWSQLDQLPAQLSRFRQEPDRFNRLQQNCLQRARAFSREHAIDQIEELLLATRRD